MVSEILNGEYDAIIDGRNGHKYSSTTQ